MNTIDKLAALGIAVGQTMTPAVIEAAQKELPESATCLLCPRFTINRAGLKEIIEAIEADKPKAKKKDGDK